MALVPPLVALIIVTVRLSGVARRKDQFSGRRHLADVTINTLILTSHEMLT